VSARLLQVATTANQLEPFDNAPNSRVGSSAGLATEIQTFLVLGRAYRSDAMPARKAK